MYIPLKEALVVDTLLVVWQGIGTRDSSTCTMRCKSVASVAWLVSVAQPVLFYGYFSGQRE